MKQELLTTHEAAEIVGCCPATIRNWAKGGKLPYILKPLPSPHGYRKTMLYPAEEVRQLHRRLGIPHENLLTKSQVAKMLHISPYTVYKWSNAGKFPYIETLRMGRGGSTVRMYPADAVEKLADELWGPIVVPDNWGHWFAGLVDGEGSFTMTFRRSGELDTPVFRITFRDDDGQILYDIRNVLGIGQMRSNKGRDIHANGKIYKSRPTLTFSTTNLREAYKLTTVLDRYPLRTKKRKDYLLWKEGITEFLLPIQDRDRSKLKGLAQRLRNIKKYKPPLQLG